jgi:hypothetical protein
MIPPNQAGEADAALGAAAYRQHRWALSMRQLLQAVVIFAVLTCAPSDPGMRTLSAPEHVGASVDFVPKDAWEKCEESVREDLKYDPQRAELALTSTKVRAVATSEYATDTYGPYLWRFDADLLASNAFGTLVRAQVRCYIAFDPNPGESYGPFVHAEILADGEESSMWESDG